MNTDDVGFDPGVKTMLDNTVLISVSCEILKTDSAMRILCKLNELLIATGWLSWLSIGLPCGRSWVQPPPDQHSGSLNN